MANINSTLAHSPEWVTASVKMQGGNMTISPRYAAKDRQFFIICITQAQTTRYVIALSWVPLFKWLQTILSALAPLTALLNVYLDNAAWTGVMVFFAGIKKPDQLKLLFQGV